MQVREKVLSLIDEYQITNIVFEDIQLQNNAEIFKTLAEVYGVLLELFTEINMPYKSVLASSWKSTLHITGSKRSEQKRNAQNWVEANYGVRPTQDECDAICIGRHYLIREVGISWATS